MKGVAGKREKIGGHSAIYLRRRKDGDKYTFPDCCIGIFIF